MVAPPSPASSLPLSLFLLLITQEGIWGGTEDVNGVRSLITARVQPGYVNCRPQGRLPGCLFEFDNPDRQCRSERKGECDTADTPFSE